MLFTEFDLTFIMVLTYILLQPHACSVQTILSIIPKFRHFTFTKTQLFSAGALHAQAHILVFKCNPCTALIFKIHAEIMAAASFAFSRNCVVLAHLR